MTDRQQKTRLRKIYQLRQKQMSFTAIGKRLKISSAQVSNLYQDAERKHAKGWLYGDWVAIFLAKLDGVENKSEKALDVVARRG